MKIILGCDIKLPLHKHYIVLQHSFSNKATSLLNLISYYSTLLLSNRKISSINLKDLITQKLNNNSIYYFDFFKNQYIKLTTFHLDDGLAIEYIQNDNFLPEPDQACVLMDDCDPIHDGNQLDFIMALKILMFMLSEKFVRDFVIVITFFIIIVLIIFIAR